MGKCLYCLSTNSFNNPLPSSTISFNFSLIISRESFSFYSSLNLSPPAQGCIPAANDWKLSLNSTKKLSPCKTGSPEAGLRWTVQGSPRLHSPRSPALLSSVLLCSQQALLVLARWPPAAPGATCSVFMFGKGARKPLFQPQDERTFSQSNWTYVGLISFPEPMTVAREMPGADWIPEHNTAKRCAYHAGSANQDPHWS